MIIKVAHMGARMRAGRTPVLLVSVVSRLTDVSGQVTVIDTYFCAPRFAAFTETAHLPAKMRLGITHVPSFVHRPEIQYISCMRCSSA
jgi:hypothetical protein